MMMPRKRRVLVVAMGVTGAAAVALLWWARGGQDWGRVERRDLVVTIDVEGELQAVDTSQIGPPQVDNTWNFTIAWMIGEGSEVTPGAPVLRFDTSQLEQELQAKIAERDEAQKSLEKAETDLEIELRKLEQRVAEAEARQRKSQLELDVPPEVAAAVELERARIDHQLAKQELESLASTQAHVQTRGSADVEALEGSRDRAAARVEALRADISAMDVKAARSGTVTYVVNRWNREKKKVGDSVWRAEKILEIPDLDRLVAEGEVAEAHMGRLTSGSRVTLRLDAHPDQTYGGTVGAIRWAVEKKSRHDPKKVVKLEIELDETDVDRMRPGMRFRGEIEVERLAGVLVVREEAVFVEPEGVAVYVRRLTGERRVEPRLGSRNRSLFAVEEGLEEGDRVRLRGVGERAER